MTEEDETTITISKLSARIDVLEQILRVTIATLDDKQREFVSKAADEYAKNRQQIADTKDTDPLRDKAEIAYDYADSIRSAIGDWGVYWDGLKDGTWIDPIATDVQDRDA